MQRESYWDYMGRRRREERMQDLIKLGHIELAEMQKQVHSMQLRIIELHSQVANLKNQIGVLGRDVKQLELDI